MDEKNQTDIETVRRAARKFKRRRDRNKPSANLLEILKQSREAAGLPLNPVKDAVSHREEDDELPATSAEPHTNRPEEDAKLDKQREPKSKPDDRPGSVNVPPTPTPSTVISGNLSPWQENITPHPTDGVFNQDRDSPHQKRNDQSYVEPVWNDQLGNWESWQDNKSVVECNLHMLTHEIECDVTLLVGETQEVINAHSYVLRSRSVQFADMLDDQKMLDNKLVTIPDVKPDTCRHLLRYLYTDEVELTVELASVLIPASSAYGPLSLKTHCFSFLLSEMTSDNVCITLEHARTFNEKNVYTRCLNFIYVNAVDVLKTPNFKHLCRECVEDIVKSDDLNADEFNVFEALLMWANGQCSRKRIQPTDLNRRNVLDNLLFHVRFAIMDALEFTRKVSHREVLSQEEMIVLYQYFHGETHKLPSEFNKSRRHEYKIKHNLVTKAFGKGQKQIELPYISSPERFQVKPYKPKEEYDTNLPVQKVVRFQGVNKDWQTKGPDAIEFRVSHPIYLRGVQIFGPYNGRQSCQVDMTIYDDCKNVICYDEKTIVPEGPVKVYDVILSSSVYVPAARNFTILIILRGKPTYHGINGLELVEKDGVTFQFFNSSKSLNGTDITIGQIPTILFSKLRGKYDQI